MNTTKKGDDFELITFGYINDAIKSGNLGLLSDSCKVFHKKGYYSKERESEIIVDISIEVWLKDAPKWSLLWVWECKNLTHNLPIDDVEEFHAKLSQITGDNVKGGIAVTGGLQKSALTYANNKGLSVVRIIPEKQIEWIVYNMTSAMMNSNHNLDKNNIYDGLTNPRYVSKNRRFYGFSDNKYFEDWITLLKLGLKIDNSL